MNTFILLLLTTAPFWLGGCWALLFRRSLPPPRLRAVLLLLSLLFVLILFWVWFATANYRPGEVPQ